MALMAYLCIPGRRILSLKFQQSSSIGQSQATGEFIPGSRVSYPRRLELARGIPQWASSHFGKQQSPASRTRGGVFALHGGDTRVPRPNVVRSEARHDMSMCPRYADCMRSQSSQLGNILKAFSTCRIFKSRLELGRSVMGAAISPRGAFK
jgi:hypothetical protein